MIRFLFLLIIAAIVLALAFLKFNHVSTSKKMTVVGGGLTAAAAGILLQNGFSWYMPILALVGISLASALVYMKLVEREELEKKRLAEERKERRHSEVKPKATKVEFEKTPASTPIPSKIDMTKKLEPASGHETIQERQTVPARETIKMLDDEDTTEKRYGMQSIQPVGKGR